MSDNSTLSPSGKEAIEILDDLYNALDFDAAQGSHNLQRGPSVWEEGSSSRGSHSSPEIRSKEPWRIPTEEYLNCKKETIRELARGSTEILNKSSLVKDKALERSKSEKINATDRSINYEPVRLRINTDEEEQVKVFKNWRRVI